jgi:hypothetical protein
VTLWFVRNSLLWTRCGCGSGAFLQFDNFFPVKITRCSLRPYSMKEMGLLEDGAIWFWKFSTKSLPAGTFLRYLKPVLCTLARASISIESSTT